MLDEGTIEELHGLVPLLEQEESVKVVIFESVDRDFFLAHYDTSRARQSSGKVGPTVRRATIHGPISSCGWAKRPSSVSPR
jgi:enoyl-CoA hydratase/carnithine racemase